jgi:hypothetical protein
MNENEIFQGCQYIALYMGWKPSEIRAYLTLKAPNMGKIAFNESMDLLMPVIEKIESEPTNKEEGEVYQFSITGDAIAITKFDDGSGIIVSRANEIGKSKLQSTFEVVADFCKQKVTGEELTISLI